ncbi:hypothetical protein BC941DRAFT_442936 [Chlamydoabsidia padenii]|nr:hypothetical protein BC941DRAFT_442936 [Chlamydoabsidia padenii]
MTCQQYQADSVNQRRMSKKRSTTSSSRLKQSTSTSTNRKIAGTVSALRPAQALTIREHILVIEAAQLMAAKRSDCVLVVDDEDHLSGIFTAKDLAYRVVAESQDARAITVADIMTHKPLCVTSDTSAQDALNLMVSRGFRHLPVCNEEGDIFGLLDITKCLYEALNKMERAYGSSRKLYDALEGVEREWVNSPVQFVAYMEALRDKMSCPDLTSVLEDPHQNEADPAVQVLVKAQVRDVAKLMKEYHTTAVLVMDHGGLAGIFTTEVLRVIAAGLQPDNCSVVRVMTPHPRCCLPSTTILEALKIMHDGHFLNLPVVNEDKQIIGLVDVLRLTYATLERINDIEGNGGEGASKFWNNIAAANDHTIETDSAISDSLSQAANSHMFRSSPSATPQPDLMLHHSSAYAGHQDPMDDDLIQPGDSASMVQQQKENDLGSVLSSSNVSAGTFSFKFNYGSKTYRFRSSDYSLGEIRAIVRQKIMMDHLSLSQSYVAIESKKKTNSNDDGDDEEQEQEMEEDDSWLTISYVDDENDQVLMTTDADVQEAVQLTRKMGRDRVRLFVHDTLIESMPEPPLAQPTVLPYTPPPTQQQQLPVLSDPPLPKNDDPIIPPSRSPNQQLSKKQAKPSVQEHSDNEEDYIKRRRDYAKEFNLPIPQELLLPAAVTFLGVVILGVFTISRLTVF